MLERSAILIADDDEILLKAISKLLRTRGHGCDCVNNAADAIEKLRTNDYELLISDIQMPGNQDLALVRRIPEIAPGLPVILLTGYPSIQTAVDAFQLPVVAYLLKPVEPDSLLSAIDRAIEDCRSLHAVQRILNRLRSLCSELSTVAPPVQPGTQTCGANRLNALPPVIEHLKNLEFQTLALTSRYERPTDAPPPAELLSAIRDTIAVLEKTKTAFKSKDLGALRCRLEALVEKGARQSRKTLSEHSSRTDIPPMN